MTDITIKQEVGQMNKFNETLTNLNELTVGEISEIIQLAKEIQQEKIRGKDD